MANNRYFMLCDCGSTCYLGKSLGDGIYGTTATPAEMRETMLEWMWEHLIGCDHPLAPKDPILGAEWVSGEIFKVITEGDPRSPHGSIPPFVSEPSQ